MKTTEGMRCSSNREQVTRQGGSPITPASYRKDHVVQVQDQDTLSEPGRKASRPPLFTNPVLWMVLVALLLRIALILYFRYYDFSPVQTMVFESVHAPDVVRHFPFAFGYETGAVAYSLATGHGFSSPFAGSTGPTAWLAPLYPGMCALVFKLFGCFTLISGFVILALNSLFSALNCIPICRIGELVVGRKVGLWAGWIWAAGIVFMHWATTWVWEVSLSALLLSVLFLQSLRLTKDPGWKAWAGFGLLWGVAALTNPALLAFLPASALYPAYRLWRNHFSWLRPVGVATLAFAVCISPWMIRNRLTFSKWLFVRDNAPFEFHLGNYHFSNGLGWLGKHPSQNKLEYAEYQRMGELAYVAAKGQDAWQFVKQYPREFLTLCGIRFAAFWTSSDLIFDIWPRWVFWPLSALTLLGLIVALAYRTPGGWLYFWLLLCYPMTYYVVYAQPRYRHPIEPEMLLLSTYFLYLTVQDVGARLSGRTPGRTAGRELAASQGPGHHSVPEQK
jgi:hypothetical protein